MIYSMTGYGKASAQMPNKTVVIEIKSLNSKFLDLNFRLPSIYKDKELELRQLLSNTLNRGRVDLLITLEGEGISQNYAINKEAIKVYITSFQQICLELNIHNQDFLQAAMTIPDALKADKQEVNEQEWETLKNAIQEAIAQVNEFRKREGDELKNDITQCLQQIFAHLKIIESIAPKRYLDIKQRFRIQLQDFIEKETIDNNRFEQEMIYYLERLDINEEMVRLENHCNYFITEMNATNDIFKGKKLNFIAQEIGREINTIGSKANNVAIQQSVVQMKDELEKIKEQLNNLL